MKRALILLSLVLSPVAFAQPGLVKGQVACLSLKDARNYATFTTQAPQFARDLLARAACYEVKEPTDALPQGPQQQGFQAYALLSGHKVWVPVTR